MAITARSNQRKEERMASLSESDLEICSRLFKFRKEILGLTREAFGEKLGVSGVVIQTLEDGRKTVRDPILTQLCQTYGLSREWIMHGEGEMYEESELKVLKTLGVRFGLNADDVELIRRYMHMEPAEREAIRKMCGMP